MVRKTLLAAEAAAEEAETDIRNLVVSEARVDEGPTIKRFQPKDRGRAHPIKKRTCHIYVAVGRKGITQDHGTKKLIHSVSASASPRLTRAAGTPLRRCTASCWSKTRRSASSSTSD